MGQRRRQSHSPAFFVLITDYSHSLYHLLCSPTLLRAPLQSSSGSSKSQPNTSSDFNFQLPRIIIVSKMQTTVFALIFALFARVAFAIPPACLLHAVNTADAPGDLSAVCGDGATDVQPYMASNCGDFEEA